MAYSFLFLSAVRYFLNYSRQRQLFFVFLEVICTVFLLESLYSTGGIDKLLLARIERMAHRAYLRMYLLCRAIGLEGTAAAAANHYFIVFWMYLFFHNYGTPANKNLHSK